MHVGQYRDIFWQIQNCYRFRRKKNTCNSAKNLTNHNKKKYYSEKIGDSNLDFFLIIVKDRLHLMIY